jgi:hypothetical protein
LCAIRRKRQQLANDAELWAEAPRGGVEVARDDDLGGGVGVEDLVDEPANLQGLRHPFHRGYEGALGPGVGGPPGVAVDLLAGDVGRDLRLQVHVDYVQSVPAGQVELHVQEGPLETYRDDAVH